MKEVAETAKLFTWYGEFRVRISTDTNRFSWFFAYSLQPNAEAVACIALGYKWPIVPSYFRFIDPDNSPVQSDGM